MKLPEQIERDAWIAGPHRYNLTRVWDRGLKRVVWIGFNPSIADAMQDDMTIRKMMGFTHRWGFGGIDVVNLFAFRSTDPLALRNLTEDAAVGQNNDEVIRTVVGQSHVARVVLSWGDQTAISLLDSRRIKVLRMIADLGRETYCLGVTATGEPRHPSRIGYDAKLIRTRWEPVLGLILT